MELKCTTAKLLCVPIYCICYATRGLKLPEVLFTNKNMLLICFCYLLLLQSWNYLVHTTQANSFFPSKGGQGRPVLLQAASIWCILTLSGDDVDAFIVASESWQGR